MHLDESDVEQQTELMYTDDTIWKAVFHADKLAVERLIDDDPQVIDERGAVGECPIHLLFLIGSDEHLSIAQDLITRFPRIVTQVYNKPVSDQGEGSIGFVFECDHLDLLWRKYSAYCHCQTQCNDGGMVDE